MAHKAGKVVGMESLLFPIIMLAVTLTGGGLSLFLLNNKQKKMKKKTENSPLLTAQRFVNVKDIRGSYLYTRDGFIFIYLRIHPISIDLYSKTEKAMLIKTLTAELSDLQFPFKFIALSRPVDISPIITDLSEMVREAEDKRKELLRQEILQMSGYALSGEIVERQYYVCLWDSYEEDKENEISKRAALLCEKLMAGSVFGDILSEKEIARLLNLINNPSYVHLEDAEFSPSIPVLDT